MKLVLVVTLAVLLSGCATSTGWQVGFGVWPVNSMTNQQMLTQKAMKKEANHEQPNY